VFPAMIKQFLTDVCWRDLDYLIIDTPPGTSDEHITVVSTLKQYKPDGAILVTTPQVKLFYCVYILIKLLFCSSPYDIDVE